MLDKYNVFDFSSEYKFLENYNIKAGINNVFDEAYATRRSTGYPGPGILPGEGRTFYISVGAKF
jgi:Fe(3+) dicitrate transport protein